MAAFALDYDDSSYYARYTRALAYIKMNNSEAAQNDLLAALETCDKEKPEEVKKIRDTYKKVLLNQEETINP